MLVLSFIPSEPDRRKSTISEFMEDMIPTVCEGVAQVHWMEAANSVILDFFNAVDERRSISHSHHCSKRKMAMVKASDSQRMKIPGDRYR